MIDCALTGYLGSSGWQSIVVSEMEMVLVLPRPFSALSEVVLGVIVRKPAEVAGTSYEVSSLGAKVAGMVVQHTHRQTRLLRRIPCNERIRLSEMLHRCLERTQAICEREDTQFSRYRGKSPTRGHSSYGRCCRRMRGTVTCRASLPTHFLLPKQLGHASRVRCHAS